MIMHEDIKRKTALRLLKKILIHSSCVNNFSALKFRSYFYFSLFSGIFLLFSCTYDSRKNETDTESLQWMYLLKTNPVEPVPYCENSQNAALSCITSSNPTATTAAYIGTLNAIYKTAIASADAPAICNALNASPYFPDPSKEPSAWDYKTYTPGAKICFFKCEKVYWDTMANKGLCTSAKFPGYTISSTNPEYKKCMDDCLVTGTVFY